MHAEGVPQAPLAVHVATLLPWHSVWAGAQTPVQTPPTQVWFTQATAAPHVPAALQVWTPLFEHCVAPGAHWVHAPFQHTGVAPEHVVWFCQWPVPSQVCVMLPEHCVCPAAHTPVHAPPTQV